MKKLLATILLLLGIPANSLAAIAFVSATFTYVGGAGTSVTQAYTTSGSDRHLDVCVQNSGLQTISGVTYNSVALTQVAQDVSTSTNFSMWRLVNPTLGANDVVVTLTGTGEDVLIGIRSYTGVHQTVPVGTPATLFAVDDIADLTVSSASGELVIGCFGLSSDGTTEPNATGGQTERLIDDADDVTTRWIGLDEEAGAASVQGVWEWDAEFADVGYILLPLKPAAAVTTRRRVMVLE